MNQESRNAGFELPLLRSTEDAEAFGREMTRDQWILCEGAKQGLQREFDELGQLRSADRVVHHSINERRAVLALKIQLYREAQEVAPFPTLVALLRHAAVIAACALMWLGGCADPTFLDIVTAPIALYCAAGDAIQNAHDAHATPTPTPTPQQ